MSGLVYCECGHTADEHVGGRCRHLNQGRKFPQPALCACRRLQPDLRLVDSDDFIGKVVEKVRTAHNFDLEPVEREEIEQVLRIALWKTAGKYDSRSHVRFRVYAYLELYNDAIDHLRAERGRHGQHRVFDPRDLDPVGDGPAGADRLDSTPSRDPRDDPDGWAADAGGLLTSGDHPSARLEGLPDRRRDRPDPRRDPRPVQPDARRPGAEAA